MSKWVHRLIITLLIATGLTILAFPFVSDYLTSHQQNQLVERYETATNQKPLYLLAEKGNQVLDWLKNPFEKNQVQERKPTPKKTNNRVNAALAEIKMLGTIHIPKINVKLPIFAGVGDVQLKEGAGLLSQTSRLTGKKGAYSLITAHRGLPGSKLFTDLPELKIDDEFYLYTKKTKKMTYRVDKIETIKPTELNKIKAPNQQANYVTLMTCTPYMINTHRLLVQGHRIPNHDASLPKQTPSKNPLWLLLAIISGLVVSLIGWRGWVSYRRRREK